MVKRSYIVISFENFMEVKEPITAHECDIVKASWSALIDEQGLETVGAFVFKRIFENAPDAIEAAPWKND